MERAPEQKQEPLTEQLKRGQDEVRQVRIDFMAIAEDVRVLVRKESELARAEVMEQVEHVKRGAMFGGAALVAAMLAAIFILVTAMLVLNTFLPLWLAALITTLIVAAGAVFAAALAMKQFKSLSLTPKRTIASIREDVEWARNQMKSSAK